MNGHVCKVCKYIAIDGEAPERCPVCGSPKSAFLENKDAINLPKDAGSLSELEKKHVPVITLVKKCGLIPDGCMDVHVKLGEVSHPMVEVHHIMHIDFYIDKKFIARTQLTPEKLNAAAALHLKPGTGRIEAVALCNQHGAWFKEAEL